MSGPLQPTPNLCLIVSKCFTEKFSQYLLAWADNLIELKTICHSGKKANMVVRVDEHGRAVTDGPQVEVGGNERYVSVSRAEFKKIMSGESAIELQQPVLKLDSPE